MAKHEIEEMDHHHLHLLVTKSDLITFRTFIINRSEHLPIFSHMLSATIIKHTKQILFLLDTQTCLGPWRLVTKAFDTQIDFLLVPMTLLEI
jgi:hypothetical protein